MYVVILRLDRHSARDSSRQTVAVTGRDQVTAQIHHQMSWDALGLSTRLDEAVESDDESYFDGRIVTLVVYPKKETASM